MKQALKNILSSSLVLLLAGALFQGCNKEDQAMKWVDLRYRVEDSYTVAATSPEAITFQVKSTDPWKVFGAEGSLWYSISPSEGKAGETFDVTVQCQDNTELDDRTDTLIIQSDYWIGKEVLLTQKGTAFLNVSGLDVISQLGDVNEAFNVETNQKWTAEVTLGEKWLSIVSGTSGEGGGSITVKATVNTGERRTGIVTIYDRNGKVAQNVECVQAGVVLTPEEPGYYPYFRLYEQARTLTIHVESNSEWTVAKGNEADETWYSFEKTDFNGSDDIVVKVNENTGTSVREGEIILSSKAGEGSVPVQKTIRIKQANPKVPEVHETNATLGSYSGPGGLMKGTYSFHIGPMGGANLNFFFYWAGKYSGGGDVEIRYHILSGITQLSTRPWSSQVYSEHSGCRKNVDRAVDNVLTLEIRDTVVSGSTWMYNEWILNGSLIVSDISNGLNTFTGKDDTWKVPFSDTLEGGNFKISTTADVLFKKWEFTAPINWGE